MRGALIILLALTTTASAQALKRTPEEAAVAKAVKRAERAGFEKHDLKAYLAGFTDDAKWTYGRGETAGPYDFTLNRAQRSARAALRFKTALAGIETLYFNDEKFDLEGDTGTYTAMVERHFFGGDDARMQHYTVKKTPKGWRISAVRVGLMRQVVSGEPRIYDKQSLEEMDREVTSSEKLDPIVYFSSLVAAQRMPEARAVAEKFTVDKPNENRAWAALSSILVEFGEIEAAKAASDKAMALDPSTVTPFSK